jgi:hypothetical protein
MENNLPPFYVGQKVIAIQDHSRLTFKKGQMFIVLDIRFYCCSWEIFIGVNEAPLPDPYCMYEQKCCRCSKIELSRDIRCFFYADLFAPVYENFQSISLSKILEEETKLISIN